MQEGYSLEFDDTNGRLPTIRNNFLGNLIFLSGPAAVKILAHENQEPFPRRLLAGWAASYSTSTCLEKRAR